jgi:hypothetical protein
MLGIYLRGEGERSGVVLSVYVCVLASGNQFHQYYIYGTFDSCKMEKERMKNCFKWKTMGKSKDEARVR